jgi:predicted DNA-binding WGR domain protein
VNYLVEFSGGGIMRDGVMSYYLECHRNGSHKFYRIVLTSLMGGRVEWGRIGTLGQTQVVTRHEALKRLEEKRAKGYRDARDPADPEQGFIDVATDAFEAVGVKAPKTKAKKKQDQPSGEWTPGKRKLKAL